VYAESAAAVGLSGLRELPFAATASWLAPAAHPAFYSRGLQELERTVGQRAAFDLLVEAYQLPIEG
jgi:hypothetical protein